MSGMSSRRLFIRLVLLAVLMTGLIVAGAFPQVIPAGIRQFFVADESSPKAVLCRDEAVKKHPADMQVIGTTPDGTGKTMINRNARAYADAYAACLDRH
jgi:hypothetical protein